MGLIGWIGRQIGKGIEKIGDKVAEKTGWYGISELGTAIQDICSGGKQKRYRGNFAGD